MAQPTTPHRGGTPMSTTTTTTATGVSPPTSVANSAQIYQRLRFLDDAANILFIGPPGGGKTMVSICLARLAAESGHKAYFTTCEEVVLRLKKAVAEHRLATGLRFFTQPRLLVLDEFGYRRLD